MAGPERLSRAELGRLTAARYGADPGGIPTCTMVESASGPRPAHVVLDSSARWLC